MIEMPRVLFSLSFLLLLLLALFTPLYAENTEGEETDTEENVNSDVVTLTSDTYEKAIKDNQYILVEFYAPWCGHCKSLAPEYEKAATALVDFTPKITLAKVDCTTNEELCTKQDIKGFPTVRFFKSGVPKEYTGEREAQSIVDWLKKKIAPAVLDVSKEDLAKLREENSEKVVIVAYTTADSEAHKQFSAIADYDLADKWVSLRATFDDEANKNKIVIHRPFGEDVSFDTTQTFTAEELFAWIDEHANPYVGEISAQFERLQVRGLPIGLIFVDEEATPVDDILEWFTPIAKEYYKQMSFAYVMKKFHARLSQLGASGEVLPTLVVLGQSHLKWPFDETLPFNKENVEKMVAGIISGSISPFIKSEPVPETNDEPVKVIVGKTFKSIALDDTKDVLVEFYAPWCGHCKSLVPVYNQLAEHYKDHPSVVIAKMDATANDQESVRVSGYPSIYLFPKGDKSNPISFNENRALEKFISFIEKNIGSSSETEGASQKDEL